ncbi:MAG: S9 family peptidase [Parvularculaceae bacterium]|nr:S9 family peptidase [Parvularculaceae bacterium]
MKIAALLASIAACLAAIAAPSAAAAPPPIEAYGSLPDLGSIAISPNGRLVALLTKTEGRQSLVVNELCKGVVGGFFTDKLKTRSVYFADDDHVILRASTTTDMAGLTERFEYSTAFSYSIKNKKIVQLLNRESSLVAQSGLGLIVAVVERGGRNVALMPAWVATSAAGQVREEARPIRVLFEVDLDTGSARNPLSGSEHTIDFFANAKGEVIAREDFDDTKDIYQIRRREGNGWKVILEATGELPPYNVVGVTENGAGLILAAEGGGRGNEVLSEIDLDGNTIANAKLALIERSIVATIVDNNRNVYGVAYSGMYPEYRFFDSSLDGAVGAAQNALPGYAVSLVDWTPDFSKMIFLAEGTGESGSYFLFERAASRMARLGPRRPAITREHVGPILAIEYRARDGLKIPAVLNLPPSGETKNLPLIVLPHGGPESYDAVAFDWMAQYFASRGFMVLQPNFRGSTGFGLSFRDAGRGEWGGKMQDDVTDSVNALVKTGRADPNRVCIMGASYGGYSALAGGAFTPSLYKCVVAIAPVSDIPVMLRTEARSSGAQSWVVSYWRKVIGDVRGDIEKLRRISPANNAAAFQAPVLLIHGSNDTVVPIDQSERMARALKAAGKSVDFVRLKGEDHYLSNGETRLEALKAAAAFIEAQIGTR